MRGRPSTPSPASCSPHGPGRPGGARRPQRPEDPCGPRPAPVRGSRHLLRVQPPQPHGLGAGHQDHSQQGGQQHCAHLPRSTRQQPARARAERPSRLWTPGYMALNAVVWAALITRLPPASLLVLQPCRGARRGWDRVRGPFHPGFSSGPPLGSFQNEHPAHSCTIPSLPGRQPSVTQSRRERDPALEPRPRSRLRRKARTNSSSRSCGFGYLLF